MYPRESHQQGGLLWVWLKCEGVFTGHGSAMLPSTYLNTKSCLDCLSLIPMWMVRTMSTWNLREYENNIRMAPFDSMRHRPHGRLACSTRAILITDRTATPPGTESLALLRATRSETPHTHTRSHTSHHDYTTARALHIAFVQANATRPGGGCAGR